MQLLYSTYSWVSPLQTDFYKILHTRRYAGHTVITCANFGSEKLSGLGYTTQPVIRCVKYVLVDFVTLFLTGVNMTKFFQNCSLVSGTVMLTAVNLDMITHSTCRV